MSAMQRWLLFAAGSYVLGLIANWMISPYVAIAVPVVSMLGAMMWSQRNKKKVVEAELRVPEMQHREEQQAPLQQSSGFNGKDSQTSAEVQQTETSLLDPEMTSALEYIGVIEDMILLEGEKNNLDNEIVEKSLALLARLNRLIPNLAELGNANINHSILRLVRKDLNSTINPFLRLSGEAKRQNRRLLLDGIKDIDSKLNFYTNTIEQKDLMELHTKAELIQQRYRLND